MGHKWIVDVLADLRAYARMNNLHVLSKELDICAHVALGEIAMASGATTIGVGHDADRDRGLSGPGRKG